MHRALSPWCWWPRVSAQALPIGLLESPICIFILLFASLSRCCRCLYLSAGCRSLSQHAKKYPTSQVRGQPAPSIPAVSAVGPVCARCPAALAVSRCQWPRPVPVGTVATGHLKPWWEGWFWWQGAARMRTGTVGRF